MSASSTDARSEHREASGRNRVRGNLTRGNRPLRPLARVDRAVEVVVEEHAADIEERHRDEHDEPCARSATLPPASTVAGEHVGPDGGKVRHATEPQQGLGRNGLLRSRRHRRKLLEHPVHLARDRIGTIALAERGGSTSHV